MTEELRNEFLWKVTRLVAQARFLDEAADVDNKEYLLLLDELDKNLAGKGPTAERSLRSFRSGIIGYGLVSYLRGALSRIPGYLSLFKAPALILTLFPASNLDEVSEAQWDCSIRTAETIKCLFQIGEGPNKLYSTKRHLSHWTMSCVRTNPSLNGTNQSTKGRAKRVCRFLANRRFKSFSTTAPTLRPNTRSIAASSRPPRSTTHFTRAI